MEPVLNLAASREYQESRYHMLCWEGILSGIQVTDNQVFQPGYGLKRFSEFFFY